MQPWPSGSDPEALCVRRAAGAWEEKGTPSLGATSDREGNCKGLDRRRESKDLVVLQQRCQERREETRAEISLVCEQGTGESISSKA